MFKAIWYWLRNRIKRGTYNRWVFVKDGQAWVFVHPWERRVIDEKLNQGWESWTDEEARQLLELMKEVGKRMIDFGSGLGAP